MTRDKLKLLKSYQIYLNICYSVNNLERNNQKLNDLLKSQEDNLGQLTDNSMNLEFLIKKLNLEEKVLELGVDLNIKALDEEECDRLRNRMENPITKNEEGKNKLDSTNINQSQNMNENIYRNNNNMSSNMIYNSNINSNVNNTGKNNYNMGNTETNNYNMEI